MNINDLTIGQVKELSQLIPMNDACNNDLTSSVIGKYVIVRSRNEGINAGFVLKADHSGIVLKNARRLWYFKPKKTTKTESWYEGIAKNGLGDGSKISCEVIEKYIIEDYSITVCTEDAKKSIMGFDSYE